jgi:cobalamin biosynthesis Co2+ chelatase CbiK
MLGLLLGHPGLEETLHHCREQAVRTVWLIPCLALPGFSVQHEITGETGNSWAETLRRAGLEVVPVRHGLAEYDGIVQIWLDTAAELLAKWSPNPGKP